MISNWINKVYSPDMNIRYFGVSIIKFLRYLKELGDKMITLLNNITNPFTETTTTDISNTPLNFYINRVWENSNITSLNKTSYYYSDNNELFPYEVNFTTNEVIPNATYSVHFVNGEYLSQNLTLNSPNTYPDELSFNTKYNIKPDDYIVVKKQRDYNITSTTYLGQKILLTFFTSINLNTVDEIYCQQYNLTILGVFEDSIVMVYCPSTNLETFEFRNKMGIVSINIIDNKQYITFYNNVVAITNSTIMTTPSNSYQLKQDSTGYYVEGKLITEADYNVTLVNMATPVDTNYTSEFAYTFTLDNTMDYNYDLVQENSIIPLDFQLYDSSNNVYYPTVVQTIANNIIQMNFSVENPYNNILFKKVVNIERSGTILTNKINAITKFNEFLYYFIFTIPSTTNTVISVFNPTTPKIMIKSIYFTQKDGYTYFTIDNNYTLSQISRLNFIQTNTFSIEEKDYTLSPGFMNINVPNDFILNTSPNYNYKVNYDDNSILLDKNTFIYSRGVLGFQINTHNISGTISFIQYYTGSEIGLIQIPKQNMKVQVDFDYPFQYTSDNNFYILPLTYSGKEYNDNMYMLKTNQTSNDIGFAQISFNTMEYPNNTIYLYHYGTQYTGTIFDEYHDGKNIFLLISLNETINTKLSYTYSLTDYNIKQVMSISAYQKSFQFANFYTQENNTSLNVFINITENDYSRIDDSSNNMLASKFYLVSYNNYTVTNGYFPNIFIQNENMKQVMTYTQNETIKTEIPVFNNITSLFSYIRFYINDQLIEELNDDVYHLNYYLYMTEEKRQQINNIIKINTGPNGWTFTLPLSFWFTGKPGLALPILAMPYSQLRLEYKLNDLSTIITNDITNATFNANSISMIPNINISLISEFILLDSMERNLFGSYSHEYIIETFQTYVTNTVIGNTVLSKKWNGLIKDIYFISKPINYPGLTHIPSIIYYNDPKYNRYNTAVGYTPAYVATNIFTPESKPYSDDIKTIVNNRSEYNQYLAAGNKESFTRINNLNNTFGTWSNWNSSLLLYTMYYMDTYLLLLPWDKQSYVLAMYLKYLYSNSTTNSMISPIANMLIRVNGTELFARRNYNYYTNTVPCQKFNNSLPIGYYCYTFAIQPNAANPSGHLNFTNITDIAIEIQSSISSEPYQLSSVLKEYNILRIMSGIASLAWIN
jgi:hypothetical protein